MKVVILHMRLVFMSVPKLVLSLALMRQCVVCKSHIAVQKVKVILKGQRSKLSTALFVQALTSLWIEVY